MLKLPRVPKISLLSCALEVGPTLVRNQAWRASTSAVALPYFMVLARSLANVIYCIPQRRSIIGHKPLIDCDVALLLQSNILLVTSLGVIFNVMFPEWLVTFLLAAFLSLIIFASCKIAVRHWRAETILCQSVMERTTIPNTMNGCTLDEETPRENGSSSASECIVSPNGDTHTEIGRDRILQVPFSVIF